MNSVNNSVYSTRYFNLGKNKDIYRQWTNKNVLQQFISAKGVGLVCAARDMGISAYRLELILLGMCKPCSAEIASISRYVTIGTEATEVLWTYWLQQCPVVY